MSTDILDEAVEVARLAYEVEVDGRVYSPNVPEDAMRAALLAGVKVLLGEAVAINYAVVHRFATENGVDYNRLAKLVRDSVYTTPPAPVQAAPQEGEKKVRCGTENYELDAYLWKRESTGDWVLEIGGAINDTSFIIRFPESGALAPEDAVELPSYTHPSACELGELAAVAVKCGAYEYGDPSNRYYDFSSEQLQAFVAALQHRGDSQEVGRG